MKTKKSSSSGKKNGKGSSKSGKSQKKDVPIPAFKYPPALQYRWSDPSFIDKGYSFLPGEKSKKIISFAAKPAKPNANWFRVRTEIERKIYEDGSTFVEFYPDGKAKVYYPNGRLAILLKRYSDGYQLQVMQPGGKDPSGAPRLHSIAGLFDSIGNGVIYDEYGAIRICYTQRDGLLMDTPNGKNVFWQWPSLFQIEEPTQEPREFLTLEEVWKIYNAKVDADSMAGSPQSVKSDTSTKKSKAKLKSQASVSEERPASKKSSKKLDKESKSVSGISEGKPSRVVSIVSSKVSSPSLLEKVTNTMEWAARVRSRTSQMVRLAKLKHKEQKPKKMKPTPIKTVVLRINEYITFRLVDQANMSLTFMNKVHQIRFELGVIVDPSVELRVDDVDPQFVVNDKVYCPFENYLANKESLQKIINHLHHLRMRPRVKKTTGKKSCYNKSPYE